MSFLKQIIRISPLFRFPDTKLGLRTQQLSSMADNIPSPCVFCGPSGAGKSTLIKKLMDEYKDVFGFSVSHTTRKPRGSEVDGKDYHFTTREDMLSAIGRGEFIEHAEFSGNLYGTSKAAVNLVLNERRMCILDIDVQGVKSIMKTDLNPIYIFIIPPDIKVLEKRLRERKTDSEEAILKRLETATRELKFIEQNQNLGHVILNEKIELAYQELVSVLNHQICKRNANGL
ncbi:guanylate kinase-like isoform X2 [Anneissia japonica]|uniref:guanylate kinase-like isoform X2 n=1 Tax=Anneissia japonica TaxID=1529436 RepID=UPI0014258145|nr:guanylate kinase-like isoform X2 [Anneissia japonica]